MTKEFQLSGEAVPTSTSLGGGQSTTFTANDFWLPQSPTGSGEPDSHSSDAQADEN